MTKKPTRTRPLDRDGDGQDGGSLPGNQTAPMAGDQTPLEAIAEVEPELVDQVINDHGDGPDAGMHDTEITDDDDDTPTFSAEEIAAGQATDPVSQAAIDDRLRDFSDPHTHAEPAAAPAQVAARIGELTILVNAPRLYKSPEGYSSNYGAPFIAEATVDAWVEAGVAVRVPSAGHSGGVKLTHEARRLLAELKHGVQ